MHAERVVMTVREFRDTFYINPEETWVLVVNENVKGNYKLLADTTMSSPCILSDVLDREVKCWMIFTSRNYKKIVIQVK